MIVFDSELYSQKAIQQAIADYKEIACIRFVAKNGQYICYLEKVKYDYETTSLEFSNHVLNLSVALGGLKNALS